MVSNVSPEEVAACKLLDRQVLSPPYGPPLDLLGQIVWIQLERPITL